MISPLLEAAFRALLLALLVGLGLLLLRVKHVVAQKLAWSLVLAGAVAMPLAIRWQWGAHIALPAWFPSAIAAKATPAPPMPQQRTVPDLPPTQPVPGEPVALPRQTELPAVELSTPSVAPIPPAQSRWFQRLTPRNLSWVLYGVVLAVLLARLLLGLFAAMRLWFGADVIAPESLPEAFADLAVRSGAGVKTPVTIGHGILLPADYRTWDAEKLSIVLAHEASHVKQGDFYLQLLAGAHAILFWFSPLGWWLQWKLSDLSETISDRAGMRAAADGPSYAQVLLEFAARPRPTIPGVAMARSSNLSRRIERLLSEHSFTQSFTGSRLRLISAALLVPVALLAATAAVHMQTIVSAQEAQQKSITVSMQNNDSQSAQSGPTTLTVQAQKDDATAVSPDGSRNTVVLVKTQGKDAELTDGASQVSVTAGGDHGAQAFSHFVDNEGWAFLADHGEQVDLSRDWAKNYRSDLEKARQSAKGKSFLYVRHGGKTYIVDDPAVIASLEHLYGPMNLRMNLTQDVEKGIEINSQDLEKLKHLTIRMDVDKPVLSPDFSKKMEEINRSLRKLQDRLGSKDIDLAELQKKLGDMQAQLGAMQGKLSVARVELAHRKDVSDQVLNMSDQVKKTSDMALRMSNVQVQMPDSRDIDRQVQSIIDESLKDGKARPVE